MRGIHPAISATPAAGLFVVAVRRTEWLQSPLRYRHDVHTDEVRAAETGPYGHETIDLHFVPNKKSPLILRTEAGRKGRPSFGAENLTLTVQIKLKLSLPTTFFR
jgi:hypothetical protein